MTTIAWDGRTLAADRRRTLGDTPTPARKIFDVKAPDGRRYLVGCAGDSWDCVAFMRWMRTQKPEDKPALSNFSAMAIDERHRVWYVAEKLVYHEIVMPFWAIGSGSDYALGAMAAGKTAREAIRIASRLDIHTGNGCDTLSFASR